MALYLSSVIVSVSMQAVCHALDTLLTHRLVSGMATMLAKDLMSLPCVSTSFKRVPAWLAPLPELEL